MEDDAGTASVGFASFEPYDRAAKRLTATNAAVLIVDVQERLAPAMPPEVLDRLIRNVGILAEAARRFRLPVVVSEQYPKGLGHTLGAVNDALAPLGELVHRFEKTEFSACDNAAFAPLSRQLRRTDWLVVGMEAHVCVWQTVRDLVSRGTTVHVMSDGVASRTDDNKRIGLGLAERAGALVSSTEVAVFDLLRQAGSDDFKALSKLIK
jgi:nicotinamidase-related amidase